VRSTNHLGALTFWNPLGVSRPVMGLLYFTFTMLNPFRTIGYFMYRAKFKVKIFLLSVTFVYLTTRNYYLHIEHYQTSFYNRDGVCLVHGTNWVFKYKSRYFYPQTFTIMNYL